MESLVSFITKSRRKTENSLSSPDVHNIILSETVLQHLLMEGERVFTLYGIHGNLATQTVL